MPVEPDSEQHQIESIADRRVIVETMLRQVRILGIQEMKGAGRQIDGTRQLMLQHVSGAPRIVRGKSPELVQREDARARERDESSSGTARHLRVYSGGRGARRQADSQIRLCAKTVPP